MLQIVPADSAHLIGALTAEDMPTSDIGKPHQIFWSLSEGSDVAGYVGLEICGDAGLLRSLVVLPDFKRRGFGRRLAEKAVGEAATRNIGSLWLLTKTARPFFEHLGWSLRERSEAPVAIAKSDEFVSLCPASAACMSLSAR